MDTGRWTVLVGRKNSAAVLLVLSERKTREEIIS